MRQIYKRAAVGSTISLIILVVLLYFLYHFASVAQERRNNPDVGSRVVGCSWGNCSVWQYTEEGWELCATHVPRDMPEAYVACQERVGMDE